MLFCNRQKPKAFCVGDRSKHFNVHTASLNCVFETRLLHARGHGCTDV